MLTVEGPPIFSMTMAKRARVKTSGRLGGSQLTCGTVNAGEREWGPVERDGNHLFPDA